MKRCFLWIVFLSLFPVYISAVSAEWQLYDDFNSGSIDSEKWSVDYDRRDEISVEEGRAKFAHEQGHSNDSLYLRIAQNGSAVMGIKATVEVDTTCEGDVRARIAGNLGFLDGCDLWTGIQLYPDDKKIYNSISLNDPQTDESPYDLHSSQYQRPIDVKGRAFNLMMLFSNDKTTFEVEGLGKFSVRHNESIPNSTSNFRAIGTKSTLGQGPCTVYFDDVYIYLP